MGRYIHCRRAQQQRRVYHYYNFRCCPTPQIGYGYPPPHPREFHMPPPPPSPMAYNFTYNNDEFFVDDGAMFESPIPSNYHSAQNRYPPLRNSYYLDDIPPNDSAVFQAFENPRQLMPQRSYKNNFNQALDQNNGLNGCASREMMPASRTNINGICDGRKGNCANENKQIESDDVASMSKSILNKDNNGWHIMKRMGYKCGPLGKSGEGIVEPISVQIKTDRLGFGLKAKVMKLKRKYRQNAAQMQKQKKRPQKFEDSQCQEQLPDPIPPIKAIGNNHRILQKLCNTCKQPFSKANGKRASLPKFIFTKCMTQIDLSVIAQCFHEEIELLLLRLDAEATRQPDDSGIKLIVAKFSFYNGATFPFHICEQIRNDIVRVMGDYQAANLPTPVIYDMMENGDNIKFICKNEYAYQFLEGCTNLYMKHRSSFQGIYLAREPAISKSMFLYTAVCAGIMRDSKVFLQQIKLHAEGLITNRWIMVYHKVNTKIRKTFFAFILDEKSALALEYLYRDHLCICLLQIKFMKHGELPIGN